MHAIQFASSLIRTSAFSLRRAARRLRDDDFFDVPADGVSMAWTLLHLTGQLEWAVKMTLNIDSVHDVALLEKFKANRNLTVSQVEQMRGSLPSRGIIEQMFDESAERAQQALDSATEVWNSAPTDVAAVVIFPTVANVWKHVAFHLSWHLGQLATLYPQLLGPEYSEPPIRGYEGKLA